MAASHVAEVGLSTQLRVCSLKDVGEAAWDAFVQGHPEGSPFHLAAWKRLVERAFGYKGVHLAAMQGETLQGVLPLFDVRNLIIGRALISSPFAVYGGILAKNEEARLALTDAACAMARELGVQFLELRDPSPAPADQRFHPKNLYVTFIGGLNPDLDKQMAGLPRDTRYMIRKGEKKGLKAENNISRLGEFHDIYADSVRHLGTPVFSLGYFRQLFEEFPNSRLLMVDSPEGKSVAGVISLIYRDTVYPYYGGSYFGARSLAPNNFLYWELMKDAVSLGLTRFDYGRSKLGTGAYDFKRVWSLQEIPLPYRFHLVRRKQVPNFSPANKKFHAAISLWKKIPLPVTKLIGPPLVRLFP